MRTPHVCLDACIFITAWKKNRSADVVAAAQSVLDAIERGQVVGVVSSLIYSELLDGSADVLSSRFDGRKGVVVDVDERVAKCAASVRNKIRRQKRCLDYPDCIYVATAVVYGCERLVTIEGLTNGEHKLLNASAEIEREFRVKVCSPFDFLDQPTLGLEIRSIRPSN